MKKIKIKRLGNLLQVRTNDAVYHNAPYYEFDINASIFTTRNPPTFKFNYQGKLSDREQIKRNLKEQLTKCLDVEIQSIINTKILKHEDYKQLQG